ncbi:hypothetical protein KC669_02075 [Candidatus Dojkabacteria bacterium]|uniref:Uncharacterized protein n=1 Tax=Candidatus Dojkabacteria bacterium TaxID=2099670 RepID=A0A955RLK7_9BACT|nr:hypothetical protein [Candidatus Dojkabacteria bacterium]
MTKLNIYSKVIITCLVAFVGLFLFKVDVNAQSGEVIDHRINIDLFNNGDAHIKSELTLINNDPDNVISGYTYVLPAKNVINPTIEIEGELKQVPVYSSPEKTFSTLEIDFGDNVIKPNTSKKIIINAGISSFINSNFEAQYILFQPTSDKLNSLSINYPNEFGDPLYISDSDASVTQTNSITKTINILNKQNLILVMWGDEYYVDVKVDTQISNRQSGAVNSLFQLIPSTNSQQVVYNQMNNGDFGLIDKFNNSFASVSMLEGESKNISFEARVRKEQQQLLINNSLEYNIELPHFIEDDFINETEVVSNDIDKLEIAYQYLLDKYPLEFSRSNKQEIENFEKYLSDKKSLNSFDFCYLLGAYAQDLEMNIQIQYGYVVLKPDKEKVLQPHFWLLIENNDSTFLIDPYMEITTELHYYNIQYDFDRITVGTWQPEQTYNDALGLMTDSGGVVKLEITDISSFENPEGEIVIEPTNGLQRLSGFYYSPTLQIINPSTSVIKVESIEFNGQKQKVDSKFEGMEFALLPKRTNNLPLQEIRNPNFFFAGEKLEQVLIKTNSIISPELSVEYKVNYRRDEDFMVILIGILVIFIFVIWRTINRIKHSKWIML